MKPKYVCSFLSELFRIPGPGGWVFARVPEEHAPGIRLGWGRTPVTAMVNGHTWQTSVWREKTSRTLLAIPRKVRGELDHSDEVEIQLEYSIEFR